MVEMECPPEPAAANSSTVKVDKSGERVRAMFGEIAGKYDFLNHLLSLGIDHYWRWRTVRAVPPAGDEPILDICTGTGDLALAYAKASGGRAPILASDFCHPMLVRGDAKARARAADSVAFVESDSMRLPFDSNQFQIVSVAFGLRNISDTDQGLREMARVCRPGGTVAVLEFSMPRFRPIRALYGWFFRRVLPRIGQWLSPNQADAYRYLPESVLQFPEGEALAQRMRAAGLSNTRFVPLTFGVATLYIGKK